jgi:nitrogen-specific signal transduction histidine kinase
MPMKRHRSKNKDHPSLPSQVPPSMAALASGMADDFNNILTTVMGACTLIDKNESATKELLHYITLIRNSAERAATLSDRLMHAGDSPQSKESEPVNFDKGLPIATSKRDKKFKSSVVSPGNDTGGIPE